MPAFVGKCFRQFLIPNVPWHSPNRRSGGSKNISWSSIGDARFLFISRPSSLKNSEPVHVEGRYAPNRLLLSRCFAGSSVATHVPTCRGERWRGVRRSALEWLLF